MTYNYVTTIQRVGEWQYPSNNKLYIKTNVILILNDSLFYDNSVSNNMP